MVVVVVLPIITERQLGRRLRFETISGRQEIQIISLRLAKFLPPYFLSNTKPCSSTENLRTSANDRVHKPHNRTDVTGVFLRSNFDRHAVTTKLHFYLL